MQLKNLHIKSFKISRKFGHGTFLRNGGRSIDLTPLVPLVLPLLGESEVNFEDKKNYSNEVLKRFNWELLVRQSLERDGAFGAYFDHRIAVLPKRLNTDDHSNLDI